MSSSVLDAIKPVFYYYFGVWLEETPDTSEETSDEPTPIQVPEDDICESTRPSEQHEPTPKVVDDDKLVKLMSRAAAHQFKPLARPDEEYETDKEIDAICLSLIAQDYEVEILDNSTGSFSHNYPIQIVIPLKRKDDETSEYPMDKTSSNMYKVLAKKACNARCRNRFPVPAILWKKKFICRSATVANRKSSLAGEFMKNADSEDQTGEESMTRYFIKQIDNFMARFVECGKIAICGVDEKKEQDASILGLLDINCISDLMVENRKVHSAMYVSSSEKVNEEKYAIFSCLRIPYPGCEFFTEYSKMRKSPDYDQRKNGLIFKWDVIDGESTLGLTEKWVEKTLPMDWGVDWSNYKEWSLFKMTKIYLRLMLHILEAERGGMLVHCISGWDRTPLFISLLRVILWAYGDIHQSLDPKQMAYLTLGYDWYLFGHDLPNRILKKEEVMHFFINFLSDMQDPTDFVDLESSAKMKIEELRVILWENYEVMEREKQK